MPTSRDVVLRGKLVPLTKYSMFNASILNINNAVQMYIFAFLEEGERNRNRGTRKKKKDLAWKHLRKMFVDKFGTVSLRAPFQLCKNVIDSNYWLLNSIWLHTYNILTWFSHMFLRMLAKFETITKHRHENGNNNCLCFHILGIRALKLCISIILFCFFSTVFLGILNECELGTWYLVGWVLDAWAQCLHDDILIFVRLLVSHVALFSVRFVYNFQSHESNTSPFIFV